jgi:ribosomal protein S18 acetylase RimI-like enzyme
MPLAEASELTIRTFTADDVEAAAPITAAAFGIDISLQPDELRWQRRLAHSIETDPGGCFVAERDGRVVGVTQAIVRERLWCLSMLAVDPTGQSGGAGRALLQHALDYGSNADAGLIVSSNDPRALRLYGLAGFTLRPTFSAEGAVDRGALPPANPDVKQIDAYELDSLEEISRRVRGAAHPRELEFELGRGSVVLRYRDRGFVVVQPERGVWLLVAHDEEAARILLWHGLDVVSARDGGDIAIRWITGDQDWAIEIVLQAGLRLSAYGALAVRGRPGTLRPYIPSPPFA